MSLSVFLSQALVAFVIEADNEFEHRMQTYSTTRGGGRGPWLTSLVMWSNCLRFLGEEGLSLDCLQQLARTNTNMHGMKRWGWVTVTPDGIIRPTPAARRAQQIWPPVLDEVEHRWRERLGAEPFEKLRGLLSELAGQLDRDLPDCLPILGYGLTTRLPKAKERASAPPDLSLPALLSKVLLAFTLEFESESEISLAIAANVLRLTGPDGVRVRDLPALSGVSKEQIAVAVSFLSKRGYALVQLESPGSRVKLLVLTPKGRQTRELYSRLLNEIEERWKARFGAPAVEQLRAILEPLPLLAGLEPYPDNWRASVRKPAVLPHFPMVTHRGGYPDGS